MRRRICDRGIQFLKEIAASLFPFHKRHFQICIRLAFLVLRPAGTPVATRQRMNIHLISTWPRATSTSCSAPPRSTHRTAARSTAPCRPPRPRAPAPRPPPAARGAGGRGAGGGAPGAPRRGGGGGARPGLGREAAASAGARLVLLA